MRERGLPVVSDGSATKTTSKEEEARTLEGLSWAGAHGGVAVVKMGHFIGAQNFAGGMMALVRGNGKLPPKPGPDGIVPGAEGATDATAAVAAVENGGEAEAASDGNAPSNVNGDETPIENQYTKEEEEKHSETLRQMKGMKVYHLFKYQIPDPIPPDMNVPQSDPTPQDPSVPYNLLEALSTLRLRYEQAIKEEGTRGGTTLSTSVSYLNDDQWGGHAAAAEEGGDGNSPGNVLKMDKAKIAAAAGGAGYDEEADPLNAPDVVAAVLAFKRRLEDQNAKGKKRRVGIITERMGAQVKELLVQGRKEREMRILQEKEEERRRAESALAAPEGVEDTGRRGVSNLPAWMTKGANGDAGAAAAAANGTAPEGAADDGGEAGTKRKFVPSEANRDINVRKQKLDVEGGQTLAEIRAANEAADKAAAASTFVAQTTKEGIFGDGSKFPPFSDATPEAIDALRKYVTAQIVDFLGEEESTLIDFIIKELRKGGGCTTLSLLEEMKVVLDEDAEDFVLGLYRKMAESS